MACITPCCLWQRGLGWSAALLFLPIARRLNYWFIGLLVYWFIGLLVYWFIVCKKTLGGPYRSALPQTRQGYADHP
jgi:hypothetical protein